MGQASRLAIYHVPGAAISGRWAMTAYGIQSKTPVVANFDVNGQPPESVAPQAAVEPSVGPPGARFAFSALGFSKKEKVSYWFTGPDGKIHDAHPEGDKANDHGRVNILWQSPRDAVKGVWVITIQGIKSDKARAVPFEIR